MRGGQKSKTLPLSKNKNRVSQRRMKPKFDDKNNDNNTPYKQLMEKLINNSIPEMMLLSTPATSVASPSFQKENNGGGGMQLKRLETQIFQGSER